MDKEELKQLCLKCIDINQERIIELGEQVYRTPELGFKEVMTTKLVADAFYGLGLSPELETTHTGCKVTTGKEYKGPRVAVMGELDCVVCSDHPDSLDNGNVHACGHHVQLANMFGAAIGIMTSGVGDYLDGNVDFIAIPAEECVDYEYRSGLVNEGKLEFYGGKQEYLSQGHFDDVDIVLQCHMMEMEGKKRCILNTKGNGFISKTIKFMGKASHAGFAPEEGINALNMAELAMNNIHALRETFRDEDKVRVSVIITQGGEVVNVVPSLVTMEIMVRAFTFQAMTDAGKKVSRALKAAAYTLGGKVEIQDNIGYLPLATSPLLSALYKKNMMDFSTAGEDDFVELMETAGSTDLGDISQMKPCMHIWTGGITGGLHTKDYRLSDPYEAYIVPAKMMALTIIDLLYDDAREARTVMEQFTPCFTKEKYLQLMRENSKVDLFDGSDL